MKAEAINATTPWSLRCGGILEGQIRLISAVEYLVIATQSYRMCLEKK